MATRAFISAACAQAERAEVQARLEAANAQLASSLCARDTADIKADSMLEQVRVGLPAARAGAYGESGGGGRS
jgi:hypothetical protein